MVPTMGSPLLSYVNDMKQIEMNRSNAHSRMDPSIT